MNFIFTTKDGTKLFPIPLNQEPTHFVNEDYTRMYSVTPWNDNLTFKGGIGGGTNGKLYRNRDQFGSKS